MSKYVDEVIICEVGPRDGLQAEKTIVSTEDKVELINAIVEAGVPVVEVGSFMHPVKMPQMANTDEVFKRIVQKEGVEYRALIPNARRLRLQKGEAECFGFPRTQSGQPEPHPRGERGRL